jgi:ABC-2 type transport system permease protein
VWRSFLSVARKEVLHIVRDAGTLRIVIVLPLMQMVLFGFIDQTVHDVATVVVDQDRSTESRLLMNELTATKTFRITRITSSPAEARDEIRAGRARVGIVVPPKFREYRARRERAQVLVLIDGSDGNVSAQVLAAVNGLAAEDVSAQAELVGRTEGLAMQPVILFNPEGRTANFIIPGLVAVLMYFVAVALAANAIVREREQGTLEQLLVTPINPLGLTLGKLAPYLVLGLVEMTAVLAVMRFAFSVPIHGSITLLFVTGVIYLLSLLSLGLLISVRASSQMEAFQFTQLTALPSIFLSGYIFPFEGLPWGLRVIGLLLPPTHMIAIMRGVVLRDADTIDLLPHIGALVALSAVLVFAAAKSLKKVAA